jgi:hypothetical protein
MADMHAETLLGVLGLERKCLPASVASFAGALILGGIIGAGTALLLAPSPGRWRRKGAWDRVDEAKDALVAGFRKTPRGEPVRSLSGRAVSR